MNSIQMLEKAQQQHLPYGGYVNVQNGFSSEVFSLFPQKSQATNTKKVQDMIATQPQQTFIKQAYLGQLYDPKSQFQ